MREYGSQLIRVDHTRESIRFMWINLPTDAEMRGLFWAVNVDIQKDQVALLTRCATVKITDHENTVIAKIPMKKIPLTITDDKVKFLSMPPRRMNDQWRGELEFEGLEWRKFPHQAWVAIYAVDPSRPKVRVSWTMWS